MRPHGSPGALERRRIRAIALLEQGVPPFEVAQRFGVDRRSVRRWKAAARRGGLAALKAQPATGRPPKLTSSQRVHLDKALLDGARRAGFANDSWTCRRIARWLRLTYSVSYHPDHIGRLLRSLGWKRQRPSRGGDSRGGLKRHGWIKTS